LFERLKMGLTKVTYSMINGAAINVLDYGAVADGSWTAATSTVAGTDNYAAFASAISAAVTNKIGTVYIPSGQYRVSQQLSIPASITLAGGGNMKYGYFPAGLYIAGTILLINGAADGDCIAFTGISNIGLRDMSVFNTNNNAIRSVVSVVDVLYPTITNVSLASTRAVTGAGLYVRGATYWGTFTNIVANGNIKFGLRLYGNVNANEFTSGQYEGTWYGMYQASGTITANAFHGVKFDSSWNGTDTAFVPTYATAGLFGGATLPSYVTEIIRMDGSDRSTFSGCYFEGSGALPNYNGLPNYFVVWVGSGCENVQIINSSFAGCYLYDTGVSTVVDPTVSGPSNQGFTHSSRDFPQIQGWPFGVAQSIPTATWTKFDISEGGGNAGSELYFNASTNQITVLNAGTFLFNWNIQVATWTNAAQYLQTKIVGVRQGFGGSTTTYYSPVTVATSGNEMISTFSCISKLAAGDLLSVEIYQNSGSDKLITEANSFLNVAKLNG